MKSRVVSIEAPMKEVGEWIKVKKPTGRTKKKLFGGEAEEMELVDEWKVTDTSKTEVDFQKFSESISNEVANLVADNYRVVSVTPITTGVWNREPRVQREYNGIKFPADWSAWGCGVTKGVVIVAEKQ